MSNLTILEAAKKVAQEVATKDPSLNNSACLMALPTISYPTGKKKLSESETRIGDIKLAGDALNKADLDWYPQDKLAPFNTLRKAAKVAMLKASVEVGGLYIVSVEKLPQVMDALLIMQNQWDIHFNQLVSNYELWLEQHKQENKALISVIDKCSVSVYEFTNGFRFVINPAMKVETLFSEQTTSFANEVALTLWDEVANMAEDIHKKLFLNAEQLSQKGLRSVSKLRDKLVNLSFIHDGVDNIVSRFDDVISKMPKTGPVLNTDFFRVAHMVLQFTSATRLKAEAEGLDGIEQYEDPSFFTVDEEDIAEQETPQISSTIEVQPAENQSDIADNVINITSQFEDAVEDPGIGQIELGWASY